MAIVRGSYSSITSKQIRLIHLNTDVNDPVSGQLEVVVLEKAPPYYAISHAWTKSETAERTENGNELDISGSLSTCIINLRKFSCESSINPQPTYIWLDSISINQEDVDERSSQVVMMGSIYSKSIRTIIWLGMDRIDSTYSAWGIISDIYAVFRRQNPTAKVFSDIMIRSYDEQKHLATGLPSQNDIRWKHLGTMMGLRWFSRIWVVEEVVLSREDPIVLHGDYCYAWESLGWAATWLRRSGYMKLNWIPDPLRNVDSISDLRRNCTRWPLDALMSITQVKFHATDQRDKVYAILGLAQEAQEMPDELKPNYNIDTATLYGNVARFLLRNGLSLAVLTRAHCLEGTRIRTARLHNLRLPSWCPDWSDLKTYSEGISTSLSWVEYSDPHKPAKLDFPAGYCASGGLRARVHGTQHASDNDPVLQLSGFRVDHAVNVLKFKFHRCEDGASTNIDTKMTPILKLAFSLLPSYQISSWVTCFIQTTTASHHSLIGKSFEQALADGAAWLNGFLERNPDMTELFLLRSGTEAEAVRIGEEYPCINGNEEHYKYLVCNYCLDRCFFTTSSGQMGLGPANTLPNDLVSVILGSGVPHVLHELGDDSWCLVGESYVHGLMGGETIRAFEQGQIREEVLSLK